MPTKAIDVESAQANCFADNYGTTSARERRAVYLLHHELEFLDRTIRFHIAPPITPYTDIRLLTVARKPFERT